jgi:hypothetical protein
MQTTVDRRRRTTRAVVLFFFVLLTPGMVGAESRPSLPEAHNADTTDEIRSNGMFKVAPTGDFSPHAVRETRLDRLRDRAIEESLTEGLPAATVLTPFSAPVQPGMPPAAGESSPDKIRGLSHTIKEAVRPTYEEAVNSGVVDAIRSVMGSKPDQQTGFNSGRSGERDPTHLATEARTWDGPNGSTQALSPEQKVADRIRAEILLMALIEEITPWALSIAALYGLYHLWRFGRAYLRRKAGRHRRRHRGGRSSSRSSRSHRHHTHPAADSAPGGLPVADEPSVNSPTH